MRVRRGGQWEKVRQSQKEVEMDRLMKSVVSDVEFHGRTVGGEGCEQGEAAEITEAEAGRAAKRKPFSSPSGPQTKAKTGSVNETFSMIEEVVALNPQSNVNDDDLVPLSEPASTKLLELANKLVMENKRLKDGQIVLLQQVKDQKQMINELSKQNRAEVDCLKEETAQLIKDKEELQQRLSRANEILKLMTDVLGATEASKDGMNGRG